MDEQIETTVDIDPNVIMQPSVAPDDLTITPDDTTQAAGTKKNINTFFATSKEQRNIANQYQRDIWMEMSKPSQVQKREEIPMTSWENSEEYRLTSWENSEEYRRAQIGKKAYIMGTALFVISLMGAAALRLGAKGAMAGLAAAVKGWDAGDTAKWQAARDDYDKHVKYIEHHNDKINKEYWKLRSDESKDHNTKLRELNLFFKAHDMAAKDFLAKGLAESDRFMKAHDASVKKLTSTPKKDSDLQNYEKIISQRAEKSGVSRKVAEQAYPFEDYLKDKKSKTGASVKRTSSKYGPVFSEKFKLATTKNPKATPQQIEDALIAAGLKKEM
jgi:hypothetical protein